MSKCSSCRKLDSELNSWWDRIRLKFFNCFKGDIIDLSQEKFTQGFGDGYKKGREHERENTKQVISAYDVH